MGGAGSQSGRGRVLVTVDQPHAPVGPVEPLARGAPQGLTGPGWSLSCLLQVRGIEQTGTWPGVAQWQDSDPPTRATDIRRLAAGGPGPGISQVTVAGAAPEQAPRLDLGFCQTTPTRPNRSRLDQAWSVL